MSKGGSTTEKISSDDNDLVGWTQLDFKRDIEVGDLIGGGGVGVIYKGWYKGEEVALKTLFDPRVDENLKKEYLDELLVMSRLKHSNVVSFLGACMTPPNLCFVMELCEDSVFQLLHVRRVQFSERETFQMAIDVACAMEYLHAQRPAIIHRDLKSHNVLRAFDGSLKVCDFGLVQCRNPQAGTPAYMAPELIEGGPYNKSVDVYAFAVLLSEMFTGQIPFYMIDSAELRRKVVAGDRPRLPSFGCPKRCISMISRCWSPRPDDRDEFPTIVDELTELYQSINDTSHLKEVSGGDALDSLLFK